MREHVLAFAALATALVDQLVDHLIGLRNGAFEAADHAPARERGGQWRQERQRALAEREDLGQQLAQLLELRAALKPEHRAQDDLERQPLQARVQGDRLLARPGCHFALCQLRHQPLQRLHALSVKRGEQQLALLEVGPLVEQDHRVRAEQRFEYPRALAWVQDLGRGEEHLLDLLGVGQHDERGLSEQMYGEATAIASRDSARGRRSDGSTSRSSATQPVSADPAAVDCSCCLLALEYVHAVEYIYLMSICQATRSGLMPRGQFDRSARKAQTRARLLEAAARVYARRGFGGATLDEVAAEAGFTKGAVYDHFGSKENLLLALMEEYLAGQVIEQVELFDRARTTWERPLAGSDRFMESVQEDPDPLRLFVELWIHAQRDARLRKRLAVGLQLLRTTFARFASDSARDAGLEPHPQVAGNFASVMLGLGVGLSMLKLTDPDSVPAPLLGAALSVLVRAVESSPQARELFADLDKPRVG